MLKQAVKPPALGAARGKKAPLAGRQSMSQQATETWKETNSRLLVGVRLFAVGQGYDERGA